MSGAHGKGGMEKKVTRAEKVTPAGHGMSFHRTDPMKEEYLAMEAERIRLSPEPRFNIGS